MLLGLRAPDPNDLGAKFLILPVFLDSATHSLHHFAGIKAGIFVSSCLQSDRDSVKSCRINSRCIVYKPEKCNKVRNLRSRQLESLTCDATTIAMACGIPEHLPACTMQSLCTSGFVDAGAMIKLFMMCTKLVRLGICSEYSGIKLCVSSCLADEPHLLVHLRCKYPTSDHLNHLCRTQPPVCTSIPICSTPHCEV